MKLYFEECYIGDLGGLEFQVYMVIRVTSFVSGFSKGRKRGERESVSVSVCVCACVRVLGLLEGVGGEDYFRYQASSFTCCL